MGVNGVLGVRGKLLCPTVDGVRGTDPAELLGGLKSDSGVGGADRTGDPSASGESLVVPSCGEIP